MGNHFVFGIGTVSERTTWIQCGWWMRRRNTLIQTSCLELRSVLLCSFKMTLCNSFFPCLFFCIFSVQAFKHWSLLFDAVMFVSFHWSESPGHTEGHLNSKKTKYIPNKMCYWQKVVSYFCLISCDNDYGYMHAANVWM